MKLNMHCICTSHTDTHTKMGKALSHIPFKTHSDFSPIASGRALKANTAWHDNLLLPDSDLI